MREQDALVSVSNQVCHMHLVNVVGRVSARLRSGLLGLYLILELCAPI